MKSEKNLVRRFAHYYKPHLKLFAIDMMCAFLIAAIDLLFPIVSRYILRDVIPDKNIMLLIIIMAAMLFIYLLRTLFSYFVNYFGHIMGIRMEYDMRKDLFSHLQSMSFKFYDRIRTGKIMSRIMHDLFEITELSHHGPENLFISAVMLLGSVIILLTIEWRLAVIVFMLVLIMTWFSIVKRRRMSTAFKNVKKKISSVNATLENSISGIRVAQAFTNEKHEKKKFNEGNNKFKTAKKEAYRHMAQFVSGIDFLSGMLNLSVLGIGGFFVYRGMLDISGLLAFLLYINLVMQPIGRLSHFAQQFESGMTGFERFCEIIDVKPDIIETENPIELTSVGGEICFNDVTFSYNENNDILKNINLKIPAGKTIALAGPSGGGKTTLCKLIPRFYDVISGAITIDGINIKDLSIKSLRENIGVVDQDVFLFAGTVKDNILYGKIDADFEEVVLAAKKANIHDFIMELPDKYDTYIGERGIRLSGGQKQRISIARVFLKNPPILILDEATSSLDNETEIKIQKSLEELAEGRTSLIIAHRLSTIKNTDRIIVIDSEGIHESGTHEELLKTEGLYARLYNAQR